MKTTANIATQPGRVEQLARMIWSIKDQFDQINVYLNDFGKLGTPGCLRREKINVVHGSDIADNGKFYFLKYAKTGEFYFTLDDDIIYPKNYVAKTLENLEKHKGKIVTYHGRKLKGIGLDYYNNHEVFTFNGMVTRDQKVDVAGTGVTAFEITDTYHPTHLYRSPHLKMSDLTFSLDAAQCAKDIIVCEHGYGWFEAMKTENGIAQYFVDGKISTKVQNEIADEIFNLNTLVTQ